VTLPKLGAVQAEEAIRRKLAEGLRKTYEPLVREPLPSDFLKLIDKLERAAPRVGTPGGLPRRDVCHRTSARRD
jgi:Anti-sigma factor NepR